VGIFHSGGFAEYVSGGFVHFTSGDDILISRLPEKTATSVLINNDKAIATIGRIIVP
jgi:hypothetical protein